MKNLTYLDSIFCDRLENLVREIEISDHEEDEGGKFAKERVFFSRVVIMRERENEYEIKDPD
jgi:hypothetical protein